MELKVGDRVILKRGPFQGEIGTVLDVSSQGNYVTTAFIQLENGKQVFESKSQLELQLVAAQFIDSPDYGLAFFTAQQKKCIGIINRVSAVKIAESASSRPNSQLLLAACDYVVEANTMVVLKARHAVTTDEIKAMIRKATGLE